MPPRSGALLLALGLDVLLGEPPASLHPVVWLGKGIEAISAHRPRGRGRQLLHGVLHVIIATAASTAAGMAIDTKTRVWPAPISAAIQAIILKSTFSVRALIEAASVVEGQLEAGDVAAARQGLRALVSRPTAELEADLVASAAVESLAENAVDSMFAPLLYYVYGGLGASLAYRAINTMDAMIGYHGEHEYSGKAAALMDDALNWIPARLTGWLIVLAAGLTGRDQPSALRALLGDARRTQSPNAGWPMSAMAGALGVSLEKVGAYRLWTPGRTADAAAIGHAKHIVLATTGLAVLLLLAMDVWRQSGQG